MGDFRLCWHSLPLIYEKSTSSHIRHSSGQSSEELITSSSFCETVHSHTQVNSDNVLLNVWTWMELFMGKSPAGWQCLLWCLCQAHTGILNVYVCDRGDISYFPFVPWQLYQRLWGLFFFNFSLMDLKRERGHKDRLNLLSLWMESLISCVLICWNKSLSNLGHSQNRPFNMT